MIEDKVKELVATCLDIEISEIDMENTMIEDLGAAELDLTDLLVSLEAEFGIKIDDDRFGEINRIDQLVECVKELKEKE